MFFKKESGNKKVVKGFTLVEIIVVLVILAILAAATIPSMLGFIDDAKFKTIDNEARVVRNAAQAYATEKSAEGKTDEFIEGKINGVINSDHALHYLLQNDANGTVFKTEVKNGKIKKFNYTKEIVDYNPEEDFISGKIRYAVFDDTKSSLLHGTGQITNIDVDDFKEKMKNEIKDDLLTSLATDMAGMKTDLQTDLTASLTSDMADMETNLNSSLESGMISRITALKTNFATELGALVYPVGSYYISQSLNPSPAQLFGGTWERVNNEFLYCMGDNAKKPDNPSVALSVGGTGGNTTHTHTTGNHTLTLDEIPSHNHSLGSLGWDGASFALGSFTWKFLHVDGGNPTSSSNTGGGKAHNHGDTSSTSNIPPYTAVYCWRRMA